MILSFVIPFTNHRLRIEPQSSAAIDFYDNLGNFDIEPDYPPSKIIREKSLPDGGTSLEEWKREGFFEEGRLPLEN